MHDLVGGVPSSNATVTTEPSATPSTFTWGYRPAIDGLRAIAVTLVILFHAGLAEFDAGFVGVDVFFVLSGFLMTLVLWRPITTGEAGLLRNFYARRFRRLLPLAATTIVATVLLFVALVPLSQRVQLVESARAAALYVSNWYFIREAGDYFASTGEANPFLHFWSLAVEEQFYVVFPLLMLGLWRLRGRARNPASVLLVGTVTLSVLGFGLQLYWAQRDEIHAYYGTDARVYQMLVGAALAAFFLRRGSSATKAPLDPRFGWLFMGAIVLLATPLLEVSTSIRGALIAALSVLLLMVLERHPDRALAAALSNKTLVKIGTVSYGMYLFHWPIVVLARELWDVGPWVLFVISFGASLGLALLSGRALEQPIRRSKALGTRPLPVIAASIALSLLIALVVAVPLRSTALPVAGRPTANPEVLALATSAEVEQPVPSIDYEAVTSERSPFPSCPVDHVEQCLVVDAGPSAPRVLLVGDSHARMLLPALKQLADENGFTLYANVGPACPWLVDLDIPRSNCQSRRAAWFESDLDEIDPDVTLLAMRGREADETFPVADASLRDKSIDEITTTLANRTLDIPGFHDRNVVIVEGMPHSPVEPLDCLSATSRAIDCAFVADPDAFASDAALREVAAQREGVGTLDLDGWACTELPLCLAVEDGVATRRDTTHLTNGYVRNHTAALWQHLLESTEFRAAIAPNS